MIFGHVQKYQGLYRNIFQSREFVKKLQTLLTKRIKDHILDHLPTLNDPNLPIELAAHHMVVSLIGLIEWWLDNKMKLPKEEMARIYKLLVIQATWYVLENKNPGDPFEHS